MSTKKKGISPSPSSVKAPLMISVRDFVRGGYQHVDEPILVMSQSRALFAAYPVESSSIYLGAQPQAALLPSSSDPAWLARGVVKNPPDSLDAPKARARRKAATKPDAPTPEK